MSIVKAKDVTDAHLWLQLYPGYSEEDTAIFEEFRSEAAPEPGFLVDFTGARIRAASLWPEVRALEGTLSGPPVPGDFHAEAIEWIGLLKSVRSARDEYVAMELGAGFGTWVIAGGVAARRRGISNIRLAAVEGDAQHFESMRTHFRDNAFDPDEHMLFQAAVGVNAGIAQWPVVEDSSVSDAWGFRPIVGHDYMGRKFAKTREVRVIPMLDLVRLEPRWDLIHIDVQGYEVDICRSCVDDLNARVRWLIVGTHSRKLEGDLLDLLCRAGWILEHEKPAKFTFQPNPVTLEALTTLDGTQVWRNPRFDMLHQTGKEKATPLPKL